MKEEIFEATLAGKARLKGIRGEIQLRQAYGVVAPRQQKVEFANGR